MGLAQRRRGGAAGPDAARSRAARAVCWAAVASRPMVSIASTRPAVVEDDAVDDGVAAIRVRAPRPTRSPSVVTAAPAPGVPASCSGVVTTSDARHGAGRTRTRHRHVRTSEAPSRSGRRAGRRTRSSGRSSLTTRPQVQPRPRPHLRRRGRFSTTWSSTRDGQTGDRVELTADQDHPGLVGRDPEVPPVQGVLVVPVRPVRRDDRQQVPGQHLGGSRVERPGVLGQQGVDLVPPVAHQPARQPVQRRPGDVDVLTRDRTLRQRRTQLARRCRCRGRSASRSSRPPPPAAARPGTGTSAGSPSAHPAHRGCPGSPGDTDSRSNAPGRLEPAAQ